MKTYRALAVAFMTIVSVVAVMAITRLSIPKPEPPTHTSNVEHVGGFRLLYVDGELVRTDVDAAGVDDAMGGGASYKVRCATVDGGTDVDMAIGVDAGSTARFNFTDIEVENDSSTCVRVGLDTSVDSTHGIRVGSGCPAGSLLPLHSRVARCQSEGAGVVVDVTAGRP